MKILGLETSCDETAAGVVEDGVRLISNVVASQAQLHASFGGVVPELASREHEVNLVPVVRAALEPAGGLAGVDAAAVTVGPGLQGSLLVGMTFAKFLAHAAALPVYGVNHLEGHLAALRGATLFVPYPCFTSPSFPGDPSSCLSKSTSAWQKS